MMMNVRGLMFDDPGHIVDLHPIKFAPGGSAVSEVEMLGVGRQMGRKEVIV